MDLITPTNRPTLRAFALPWRGASLGTLCAPLRHMRQTEPNIIVLAGLLLIWPTLVGCAPQTQYRRTALVAAPVSETLIRQPRGTVQVLGSVEGGVQDTDNFPEVGDPSVLRPTLWTSGELRIRVGDYVTLGMQATYASSRVSDGSAYGTPPLDKPRSYGGFGPNLAVHIPLSDTTLLGFAAAVTLGVMPWTVYERTRPPGATEHGFDPSSHRIVESGHDVAPLMRLSVGANHRLAPWVDIDYGLSLQNAAINVGFDEVAAEGSTLTFATFGVVPWFGLSLRTPQGLLFRASYAYPLGFTDYGGGQGGTGTFLVAIGADLDVD